MTKRLPGSFSGGELPPVGSTLRVNAPPSFTVTPELERLRHQAKHLGYVLVERERIKTIAAYHYASELDAPVGTASDQEVAIASIGFGIAEKLFEHSKVLIRPAKDPGDGRTVFEVSVDVIVPAAAPPVSTSSTHPGGPLVFYTNKPKA